MAGEPGNFVPDAHAGSRSKRLGRLDRFDLAFLISAAVAAPLLIALARGTTFYRDEWSFIDGRQEWTIDTLMAPHNEHPVFWWALVYKILLSTVGLSTYLPYVAVLVLLHIAAAIGVYVLLRGQAGSQVAFCGGLVFLLLGTAGENLLWPANIGLVGSTAAGIWALALLLGPASAKRAWAVAVLLVFSVTTSGAGLFFLAAATGAVAISRARWRRAWVLLPAVVVFGVWYAAYGAERAAAGPAFSTDVLVRLPEYVRLGVANAFGRLSGWGDELGFVLLGIVLVATIWRLLRGAPLLEGAVVGLIGVFAQYAITGLVRVDAGSEQALAGRYVYMASAFLLLVVAAWIGTQGIEIRRTGAVLTLAAVTAVARAANVLALWVTRQALLNAAEETRATVTVLTRFGGSPAVPADRGLYPIPGSARLGQIFASYGSPMSDALADAPPPSGAALDRVLLRLVADEVVIQQAAAPASSRPPTPEAGRDVVTEADDECLSATPIGEQPQVTMSIPGGEALDFEPSVSGTVRVSLAVYGEFQADASVAADVSAGRVYRLGLPDLGSNASWSVRLDLPGGGSTRICQAPLS